MQVTSHEKQLIENFMLYLQAPSLAIATPDQERIKYRLEEYCHKKKQIDSLLTKNTIYYRQVGRMIGGLVMGICCYLLHKQSKDNACKYAIDFTASHSGILLGEKLGCLCANQLHSHSSNVSEVITRIKELLNQSISEQNSTVSNQDLILKIINHDIEDLNIQSQAITEILAEERKSAHLSAISAELIPNNNCQLVLRPSIACLGAYSNYMQSTFEEKTQQLREQKAQHRPLATP